MGIEPGVLWNATPMLSQLSYEVRSILVCDILKLSVVPVMVISALKITFMISKELDLVLKYHILEPTRLRSSVGRALG